MLKNYLKVALRNIWRNKVFSFINVFGLALGVACSLLILLWVQDEWRYDRFHAGGDRLYRVLANVYWADLATLETTPGPLAEVLKNEVPEVEYVTKMTGWDLGGIFQAGNTAGKEQRGRFASPDLFRMFSFPLVQGSPGKALLSPNSVVISQSLARKYFGRQNPLGKLIRFKGELEVDLMVTGVMQDLPRHSSLQFDYVIPFAFFEQRASWAKTWGNFSFQTYVTLRPDASRQRVEAKIKHLLGRQNKGVKDELFLQPFTDMYLHSNFENGRPAGGRIEYVRLFSVVAVFILTIACINYMNLATARSARRAKEVGIRKVVGGSRFSLAGQFTGEALLMALFAVGVAVPLVSLLLPAFNDLTIKQVAFNFDARSLLGLLAAALLTGLVSGSYPALFLSSLSPERVLKGSLKFGSGALLFRKGLVVFQFTLSILLIVGTLLVYRQIQYVKNKHLGLDRKNVIALALEGELFKRQEVIGQEVSRLPGVRLVTMTSGDPTQVDGLSADLDWPGKGAKEVVQAAGLKVGYDFLSTLNIPLKEGRDFSRQFATDSSNYIINEAAAKAMRLEHPIGQEIKFWQGKGRIVGVVKDFHQTSLHQTIRPLIIMLVPKYHGLLLVKTEPGSTAQVLAGLQRLSRTYNPQYPFEYHFLDETFERQYKSETLVGELAKYFAILAVFISCLGLFGLAAFTAEQRTKEIGIRKVLGASLINLVALLSIDFVKLVGVAFVLATPVAWYTISEWLQKFAYREEITWWIFALAGTLAVLIAVLTVGFQSVKAALANPVKSLRSE